MIVLGIVNSALAVGNVALTNSIGQQVTATLRAAVYGRAQAQELDFYTEENTSEVQMRLVSDIDGVDRFVTNTVQQALAASTALAAAGIAMLVLSWPLALLSFAMAYPLALLNHRFAKKRKDLARERQLHLTSVLRFADEDLSLGGGHSGPDAAPDELAARTVHRRVPATARGHRSAAGCGRRRLRDHRSVVRLRPAAGVLAVFPLRHVRPQLWSATTSGGNALTASGRERASNCAFPDTKSSSAPSAPPPWTKASALRAISRGAPQLDGTVPIITNRVVDERALIRGQVTKNSGHVLIRPDLISIRHQATTTAARRRSANRLALVGYVLLGMAVLSFTTAPFALTRFPL
jgi:hypothetical protein